MDREELILANEKLLQLRLQNAARTKQPEILSQAQVCPSGLSPTDNQQGQIEVKELIITQTVTGKRELWDSLDTSVHGDLEQGKQLVHAWYKFGMNEGYSCLVAGNVGCGKSHLARAILEAMTPFKAIFIEETKFIKQLQDSYGDNATSELAIIERCVEAELLIYDDLGAYQTNNLGWIENIYRMIFENRLAKKRPVLFTTNLSFSQNDNGDFGLLEDHIGRRNYDRLLRGIFTDNGPYYADLFNVPSYQSNKLAQFLEAV